MGIFRARYGAHLFAICQFTKELFHIFAVSDRIAERHHRVEQENGGASSGGVLALIQR